MNTLKVGLMLTALTAIFVVMGRVIGGQQGMVIAFLFAIVMNFGSYWFSDRIVLSMNAARPMSETDAPELYRLTAELAQRAQIPMPKLYVIDDPQPNAFATGRDPNHAAIAVNRGLLQILDKREVEGVIAHELGHVKHRDTLIMSVVATLAGAIMMLANMGRFAAMFGGMNRQGERGGVNPLVALVMVFVAPLAAMLVQMAISRSREYEADAIAARLTGSPDGLIHALTKLDSSAARIPSRFASPQTAHLRIVNPLRGVGGIAGLFSTHPPMEERIKRLEKVAIRSVAAASLKIKIPELCPLQVLAADYFLPASKL